MEEGDGHTGHTGHTGGTGGTGFAEAIRAWRERRGWTQEELSHKSGLSTRAIRSLERGRTLKPRRTTVQMLADALQVPRARLMGTVRRAVAGEDTEQEAEPDGAYGEFGLGWGTGGGSAGAGGGSQIGGRSGGDVGAGSVGAGPVDTGFVGTDTANTALRTGDRLPRELPPDLGDPGLDVRKIVAELVAGPTEPYRAAVVRAESAEAAIRAAHHASANFPDGQLYASLAGTPAVPASALLRRFLRSLGTDRSAEAAADELAAAFRTALAGRRMLVVLVEAGSEAQIRPLLPAEARCALLVAFGPRMPTRPGPEPS